LELVIANAFQPEALDVVDGLRGRVLLTAPLGEWARERYGQPYLNVHRGDLQSTLLDAVTDAMPGALKLGCRVTSVTQSDGQCVVELDTGARVTSDFVIGADGVHSTIREHIFGTTRPPRYTGHVAYRMVIDRSEIPASATPPPRVTLRMGPHGHIVSYWVRRGELYNVVAIVEDPNWREEGWNIRADLSNVWEAFRDWDPTLRSLFGAADDIHKWALLDHPVPPQWSRGRIALLGDACHAMLPYLAQGGAMAIEDAWVLGRAVIECDDPVAALSRYSQQRVARASRVHQGAARNGHRFHRSGFVSRFVRDNTFRVLARRSEGFMQRMDWLYSCDVTGTGTAAEK
jgi:salicylate hydroxylase